MPTNFMRIIAKVKELPNSAIITKVTGEKRYQLHDKLNIFRGGSPDIKIQIGPGVYFLIPIDMALNGIMAVSEDFEVSWEVDDLSLYNWLDKRLHKS